MASQVNHSTQVNKGTLAVTPQLTLLGGSAEYQVNSGKHYKKTRNSKLLTRLYFFDNNTSPPEAEEGSGAKLVPSTSTSIMFFQKAERHRMEIYG